jgi:putative PIN family toxin of toxin-antitoxin system
MPDSLRVTFDTTVLVSAFLTTHAGGPAAELLQLCAEGAFALFVSDAILDETEDVLLNRAHLRRRFHYTDAAVREYRRGIGGLAIVLKDVAAIAPVVRDPEDDMVVACALAANADYLVTRDKDLLALRSHGQVKIHPPETFLAILRTAS